MNLDLRLPIGLMFSAFGVMLTGYGLVSEKAIYARSLGVNVTKEMNELTRYVEQWPVLAGELASMAESRNTLWRWVRSLVAGMGGSALRQRVMTAWNARKLKRGDVTTGFEVRGEDAAFHTIVDCARFLAGVAARGR